MPEIVQKNMLLALREATFPLHKKLDNAFFKNIDEVSAKEYENFLKVHYEFYAVLKENLEAGNEDFRAYLSELIEMISHDLSELNITLAKIEHKPLQIKLNAEGIKYVVYGSSNGAGMINKKLSQMNWATSLGRSFLSRKEEHWRPFLLELKTMSPDDKEVVNSAVKAFEIIHSLTIQR